MLRPSSVLYRVLGGVAAAGVVLAGAAVPASAAPSGKPPAPKSVKGVGDYTTSIKLTWKSGKGSTKGFNVYRSTSSKVSTKSSNKVNGKLLTSTWIRDRGLLANKTYWFVVQSVGKNNKTTNAKAIAVKTREAAPLPAVLTGTPGDRSAKLTWTPARRGGRVAGWTIYRATTSSGDVFKTGSVVTKTRLPASARSYTNAGRVNGTTYRYVVVASNSGGSVKSNTVAVRPGFPKPGAPALTLNRTSTHIDLAWTPSGAAATSWKVFRSTSLPVSTSGSPLATITTVSTTTLRDTPVKATDGFHYVVVATNAGGSTTSNTVSSLPAAPHAPTLDADAGDGEVDLDWSAAGTGGPVAGWRVYRGTTTPVDSSASATPIASLSTGTTTYTDETAVNGTTYYYVVTAINGGGRASSAPASATPQPAPPAAPVLSVAKGNGFVDLTITPGTGGGQATSRALYRSTSAAGVVAPSNLIEGALTASTAAYRDEDVVNGTTYYYVVVAVNGGGSTPSNQVSARPSPPQPAALEVSNPAAVVGSAPFVMSRMTYCLSSLSGQCQTGPATGVIRAENPDNNDTLTWFKVRDLATVRITNTGDESATITGASIGAGSMPNSFVVESAPTSIPAGQSRDVTVRFVYITSATYAPVVRTGTLEVTAAGLPTISVPLTGQWQPGPNRSLDEPSVNFEPSLAQVVNGAFGMATNIGSDGLLDNNRGDQGFGDETLSRFWTRADSSKPVTVQRLAAFSSAGMSKLAWYDASTVALAMSGCGTAWYQVCHEIDPERSPNGLNVNNPALGQTLLPHDGEVYSFVPDTNRFGFQMGPELSDNERNDKTNDVTYHECTPVTSCGHHMRFYPVKNTGGQTVPGAYVVAVDFNAINNDFNDDIIVVTNIAPTTPPTN